MTQQMSLFRTDRNNNPTAFTTDIAREAGLIIKHDYIPGDQFIVKETIGKNAQGEELIVSKVYFTAKLIGDPIVKTIQVIDKIGFFTNEKQSRWSYIQLEKALWDRLTFAQKKSIIFIMYMAEGGVELNGLFS